ncbi:two-component system, NtrC family, nitrogen regulation sensor histidine kinase GlnL [Marinagarivorans cellulosilyticus]|uniref:Sensory histidine kinase/phosphatase NtrB n=2 Tax=Marinagarivorans cellulosilyticus TaxID=2721545 RepID=A0AAN1WGJ3_9GAMM|nr:two-component system, NtrC family, nitrogen regulation sensor histidine kinase GlnL [Marinagarivorans cellulosilyticus]
MVEQIHYKHILDRLVTAVILVDTHLKLSYLNSAAEVLLCVSGDQVLGRKISDCFEELDGDQNQLASAIANNNPYTKRHAKWRLHNNNEITVDYSVDPSADGNSLVIEVQPLDRLIRISKDEAMLSAQETSRNLIRSMAHEIKNPLGGIRGAAQLLGREFGESDLSEYTRIIIDETDRLRDLVDRMLGPRIPAERKPVNVHDVLEHVASVIDVEAGHTVHIQRDYDPSIPNLIGDRGQLIQSLLNISRNALQALMESNTPSPQIKLTTRIQRRFTIGRHHHPLVARVEICDNGPGIPPALISNIFFPMITGRAEGTGLGLAITQNLISQHGGLVECQSEPGKTEFTLYLPLDEHYAEA